AALPELALVPKAVASTLGLLEEPGRPLTATVVDALRSKAALLVLDNCEHLVDACAALAAALLHACPRLRVLATSRQALGVAGEAIYRAPPLSLPDLAPPARAGSGGAPGVARNEWVPPETSARTRQPDLAAADLAGYEAVRLFVERARLVHSGFTL